ncbi:MAG: site-2 protease family protein [Planctomycetota bacterium]|nr:site-2 protease family protein [Planctomycetota bacterium]MDA1248983.1 site-2 protease family protein [Planctomycetota bacterium]
MLSVEPTRYDVNFTLFGIPVRVHPAFWVVGLLLGFRAGDMRLTAIWIGCLFGSILVHELGHALVARHFGWPPNIILYHFGGLATFQPSWGYTRKRAILISLAGPGAGFVLYGVVQAVNYGLFEAHHDGQVWATKMLFSPPHPPDQPAFIPGVAFAIYQLEWINLFWGLMNLLPVYPLDGGQVCSEVLNARSGRKGMMRTHQVGMVTGAAAALFFVSQDRMFAGLMFAGIAYDNYQKYERLSKYQY